MNETTFYQWETDGEKFFTAAEPADYLRPGISGPVSRDDMLRSVELDNMADWMGLDNTWTKKLIKGWNDFVGWNSGLSYKVR